MKHVANPSLSRAVRLFPFLFLAYTFVTSTGYGFNQRDPFDISADILDYKDPNQQITAEGNVIVVQTSSTLHADFMVYDRTEQKMRARGNVILRENGSVLAGDELDYDLVAQRGTMREAKGYGSPWLFQGVSWEKIEDYYVGRQAAFTSCELMDPHYFLRSSRVHLVPDQVFWAWDNRFFVHKVPAMYSPFLYKWLGPRRVVFQVEPGHDQVNGAFARTKTTVRFTKDIYSRLLVDHYTSTGDGVGNEFYYSEGESLKGSMFGYYINPRGNPELLGAPKAPQYNIRSYHWQSLPNNLTLRSNVNMRKNVSFNNQYFRQDNNQNQIDVPSSLALTHQNKRVNQSIVAERSDAPDSGGDPLFADTHMQSASFPRYDVTMYDIPIWYPSGKPVETSSTTLAEPKRFGPILFSAGGSIGQFYTRSDRETRTQGNGRLTFTESIPLSRKFTLSPSFSPQFNFIDKAQQGGTFRGYQGRLSSAATLRYRVTSDLTLDNSYGLTNRLAPNQLTLDRSQNDRGVESHAISWVAFWRPSRSVLLRSFSGYDLRKIDNESLDNYHQRKWSTWTTEITVQPQRSHFDLFARYQLSHYPMRASLWEGSFRYAGPHKTLLETGLLYNRGLPGLLTWNNRIGIWVSPGWRVETIFHAFVPSTGWDRTVNHGKLIDSEFIVVRDMHCWEAQFTYRSRPPFAREYSLMFNLKLGMRAEKEITDEDLEGQFYPWRANPSSRRPLYQSN